MMILLLFFSMETFHVLAWRPRHDRLPSHLRRPGVRLQDPFDAAVVIPTILRPTLAQALRSVFAQDIGGRVHVLVGIDTPPADLAMLDAVCAQARPHCAVQAFWPGYSTAARHGGLSPGGSGGVLRCVLSHLANSAHVAYLDDDNWWRPDHPRLPRAALRHADWAFSLRWYVHPVSRRPVCVDQWESVGPYLGVYRDGFNGFVDPNRLMLDKRVYGGVLDQWNQPLPGDPLAMSEDRNVFDALLKGFRFAATNQPSVFHTLNPLDTNHPGRLRLMGDAYDRGGRECP